MICGWPGWVLRLRCSLATWVPTSEGLPQPPTCARRPAPDAHQMPHEGGGGVRLEDDGMGPHFEGLRVHGSQRLSDRDLGDPGDIQIGEPPEIPDRRPAGADPARLAPGGVVGPHGDRVPRLGCPPVEPGSGAVRVGFQRVVHVEVARAVQPVRLQALDDAGHRLVAFLVRKRRGRLVETRDLGVLLRAVRGSMRLVRGGRPGDGLRAGHRVPDTGGVELVRDR